MNSWNKELLYQQTPGYYWWRRNVYKSAILYYVWHDGTDFCARRSGEYLEDKVLLKDIQDGEWSGPIESPE